MNDGDSGPIADLHVHTTASDGTLTLEELPAAARAANVECVAVTDHDRPHPGLDAPVATIEGLPVVHGIELRVDAGDQRVDLLGYGVRRTEALVSETERLQRNRIERAADIVDRVEARLGVSLDIDVREGVGRPHIARAIDASAADYTYQEAFDHLIGGGGPCYVPRELPTFERGVRVLSEACAVVSLAHPFRYGDVAAALSLAPHLDAIERDYPYARAVDFGRVDAAAADHGLLVTGGSDAHERLLGRAGLQREAFERFAAAVPELAAALAE